MANKKTENNGDTSFEDALQVQKKNWKKKHYPNKEGLNPKLSGSCYYLKDGGGYYGPDPSVSDVVYGFILDHIVAKLRAFFEKLKNRKSEGHEEGGEDSE